MAGKTDKKKEPKEETDSSVSMKAYITLIQKQATEEIKHHTAALAEHMEDRIAGISEEFVNFRQKLDSHTEMIGGLAEDVAIIRMDVAVLKTDVTVLKEDVSVLKDDMSIVKKDISIMKGDIAVLKTDMVVVKEDISEIKGDLQQKVDREEFVVLDRRVTAIEVTV